MHSPVKASFRVQNLPAVQSPEVFGMHDNVNISKELQETKHMFDNVLLAQGRLNSGTRTGSYTDERLSDISANILDKVSTFAAYIPPIILYFSYMFTVGGVAQWLGRRSLAGGLSLIYA